MAAPMLCRFIQNTVSPRTRELPVRLLSAHYSIDEQLSKHAYWKQRYKQNSSTEISFEWFLESDEILDFLLDTQERCSKGKKQPVSCVDLGCGSSDLARTLLANSPRAVRLVLLDFVHEALLYQKQQISSTTALVSDSYCHFVCADVTCLPFCASSFDMAVDKGTLDALLKDQINGHSKATAMMSEVRRTLASGGRYLQISDEDPDMRLTFLDELRFCQASDSHPVTGHHAAVSDSAKSHSDHVRKNNFSPWSFKVLTSRWHREYFLFWTDKL